MATTTKSTKEASADAAAADLDPNIPAAAGKKDPVSPAVPPEPVTVTDIPANEPYPTGNPQVLTFAQINGLEPIPPAGG